MNNWKEYEYGRWRRVGEVIEIVSERSFLMMPKGIVPDYEHYRLTNSYPVVYGAGTAQWKYGGLAQAYAHVKVKGWETKTVDSKDSAK